MKAEERKAVTGKWMGYEVSNLGIVYSINDDGSAHEVIPEEKYGELVVSLLNGLTYQIEDARVDQLVAEAFLPKEEGKSYIMHKDQDESNCRVGNLKRVTFDELHKGDIGFIRGVKSNTLGLIFGSVRAASEYTGIGYNVLMDMVNDPEIADWVSCDYDAE